MLSKAKMKSDGNRKQLRFTILGLVQKKYLDGWIVWNMDEKMTKMNKLKW